MPVHVLPEPAEVDGLTPDLHPLCVEVPGLNSMMGQSQRVKNARFAGTVGAVNVRDGS